MPVTNRKSKTQTKIAKLEKINIIRGSFNLDRELFNSLKTRPTEISWKAICHDPVDDMFKAETSFEVSINAEKEDANLEGEALSIKGTFAVEFKFEENASKAMVTEFTESGGIIEAIWPYFVIYVSELVFDMGLPRIPLPPAAMHFPVAKVEEITISNKA